MSADPCDLDTLLARFADLKRRDKRAIYTALTPDSRNRLQAVLAQQAETRREEAARARRAGHQFAGYSPWLAELVQQACARGDIHDAQRGATANRAIVDIHQAIQADDESRPSDLLTEIRAWGARLLSSGRQP